MSSYVHFATWCPFESKISRRQKVKPRIDCWRTPVEYWLIDHVFVEVDRRRTCAVRVVWCCGRVPWPVDTTTLECIERTTTSAARRHFNASVTQHQYHRRDPAISHLGGPLMCCDCVRKWRYTRIYKQRVFPVKSYLAERDTWATEAGTNSSKKVI